nr:hypothetical protein [uncultured Agathobacter sp.]
MWLRGSFTIEGAIIIPIFIFMMTIVMNMSLLLYKEIKDENEQKEVTGWWLVDDFYKYQDVKEVLDEL